MVDINLIGDDQTRFEGEEKEKEKEFHESFETELNEPAPISYTSTSHIDDNDYTRVINRGGSKKLVYILAACSIILLAVAAWVIFKPHKSNKRTYEPPPSVLSEIENAAQADTSAAFNFQPDTSRFPSVSLSPALRDRVVKAHRGINTVNNIINTIPSDINFTMISYSDGTFLVEFLAGGDADINNLNAQLQQNLYSGDVKLLSKENRTVQNRQFRQALVNGNVNMSQTDVANPQEPSYLSAADLQNQIAGIARQAGLTLKQFDAGREKAEGGFMILPIMFKANGQKSNILSFLQQLSAANLNISFSKIALIANEAELTNPNITLLLNIGLYRTI